MKIRNGFVANSSSSSYLLLAAAEDVNKLQLNEVEKFLVENVATEENLFGVSVMKMSYSSGEYGSFGRGIDCDLQHKAYDVFTDGEDEITGVDLEEMLLQGMTTFENKVMALPKDRWFYHREDF